MKRLAVTDRSVRKADKQPKTAGYVWLFLIALSCASVLVPEAHSETEWLTLADIHDGAFSVPWLTVMQVAPTAASIVAGVNFALVTSRAPVWAIAISVVTPLACLLLNVHWVLSEAFRAIL